MKGMIAVRITRHEQPTTTNGEPTEIESSFPEFELKGTQGETVKSSDISGKYTLISVVPDINTRVCSLSTKKFNEDVDSFPNINFLTISTNTIEQQQDWCAAEGVTKMKLLSDAEGSLGKSIGIFVEDGRVDARSIWILDPDGEVAYRELIIEQSNEPNYQAALDFLNKNK